MPPKLRPRKFPEAIVRQQIENVDTRSIFGDNRATTEDAMMEAHAKTLREAGAIGKEMETQLSQEWHKAGELKTTYTKEYLAMHPSYIGSNVDEMPTYDTALRRQKEMDAAQEKWLADYKAGKIGMNGNLVRGRSQSSPSISSLESESELDSHDKRVQVEHTGDATVTAYDSSDDSMHGPTTAQQLLKTPTKPVQPSKFENKPSLKKAALHMGQTADRAIIVEDLPNLRIYISSSSSEQSESSNPPASTASPPSRPQSSIPIASPNPKPTPKPKRAPPSKKTTPPLPPLPGQPDYAKFNYYALAALCRTRNLSSGGGAPTLRNRLIQDDINVIQHRPRETRGYRSSRRAFKHEAPDDETIRGSSEEVVLDLRNPVGRGKGKGKGKVVEREEGSEGGSEEGFEVLEGVRGDKRKVGDGVGEGGRKKAKLTK